MRVGRDADDCLRVECCFVGAFARLAFWSELVYFPAMIPQSVLGAARSIVGSVGH